MRPQSWCKECRTAERKGKTKVLTLEVTDDRQDTIRKYRNVCGDSTPRSWIHMVKKLIETFEGTVKLTPEAQDKMQRLSKE